MLKINKFKQKRKSKGYTQAEIAPLLGLSPRTIEAYEQGRRNPSKSVLMLFDMLQDKSVDSSFRAL